MIHITCANCGILFSIPDRFDEARRQDKREFFCPNQHSLSYHESEADKLRKELVREKQRTEQLEARARNLAAERDRQQRSARAMRGQVTKIKNRLVAALCPVCDHALPDVAAHLASEHPDWAPDADLIETDITIPEAWTADELRRYYIEGALARRKGPAANPYPRRGRAAVRHNAWQAGWNDNPPRINAEASPGNA